MRAVRSFLLFITVCLSLALALNATFLGTAAAFLREGRMAYGLSVGPVAVGGMTRAEAEAALTRWADERLSDGALILTLGEERAFSFSAEEVGLSADVPRMLEAAYGVGRDGAFAARVLAALYCAAEGETLPLRGTLDEARLAGAVARAAQAVERAPRDASAAFSDDGIVIVDAAAGRRLDAAALQKDIAPRLAALELPCRAELPVEEVRPAVADAEIADVDSLLSRAVTYYEPGGGRGQNIELAAAALDGRPVRPGETLSFNETVGGRVASAGYTDAPVLVDGKVERDVGGGVCQVSSTLYNAILLAGLDATARTAHFYPSAYVPAGLDATVADGQIDFAFRNALPHTVVLRAAAAEGVLAVSVLGHGADKAGAIRLETEIVGPAPTVEVYRVVYEDGVETARELLHTDEYDAPSAA